MRLSDVDSGRHNNMDFIRFTAASAVIYGHAFYLQNLHDPMVEVTGQPTGFLAIGVFFGLSGFLIAKSLCNRPSLLEFLIARGLRILPALIVMNVVVVVVAGMFWTDLSPAEFFMDGRAWSYVVVNSSLLKCQYHLPGVFSENPGDTAVNGSLWTLPIEARMYGIVFLAGLASLILQRSPRFRSFDRLRIVGLVGILAFLVAVVAWPLLGIPSVPGVLSAAGARLMGFFGIGMAAYGMRRHLPLSGWVVLGGAFLLPLASSQILYEAILTVWLTYACLWFSYTPRINARRFGVHGDMSYGIYIFAFPIQQCLYAFDPQMRPLSNAMITFVTVLPIAAASFRFIEKPALGLKHPLALKLQSFGDRWRG